MYVSVRGPSNFGAFALFAPFVLESMEVLFILNCVTLNHRAWSVGLLPLIRAAELTVEASLSCSNRVVTVLFRENRRRYSRLGMVHCDFKRTVV